MRPHVSVPAVTATGGALSPGTPCTTAARLGVLAFLARDGYTREGRQGATTRWLKWFRCTYTDADVARSGLTVLSTGGRRRARGFEVAAALELNLDRYPMKDGLLQLLVGWRDSAKLAGLAATQPDYVKALERAIVVMSKAQSPQQAIETLQAR